MAKNAVTEWDAIAANNSDIAGIGIIGSSAVSNFDDALRTMMAQLKTLLGPQGISDFAKTLLDDANDTAARATLLAASSAEYSVVSGSPLTPNARFMMAQGTSGTGFRPLTVRTSRGMVLSSDGFHVVIPVTGTYVIVFGVAASASGLCTGVMTVNSVTSGSSVIASASSTSSGGDFRQLTAGDIVSVSVSAAGVVGSTFLQVALL